MQKTSDLIDKSTFAALFHYMLKLCYPDLRERAWMLGRSVKYLFGLDIEWEDMSLSVSGKINNSDKLSIHISGRKLYELCKDYDDPQIQKMELPSGYYKNLLLYTELSLDALTQYSAHLKKKFPGNFPPKLFEKMYLCYDLQEPPPLSEPAQEPAPVLTFTENLKMFARNKWYFYFYEYEASKPRLIRLVLSLTEIEQQYVVTLHNTSIKYTTYQGAVIEMINRRLRIDLQGEDGKVMNLMIQVDPTGDSELYLGMFMKNATGLLSCSVILHRIPPTEKSPKAETFYYHEHSIIQSVPKAIRDFFEPKMMVYTKVPKCYSVAALEEWLTKKQQERGENITHSIFLAAPVGFSEHFKSDVFTFQDALAAKFSAEVYFAPRNTEYYYRSPKNNLQTEWREFCHSKVLVILVPTEPVFSSCWVILGWAMAREMAVFLLCDTEQGIPNMVKYADVHPKVEKINISGFKCFPDDAVEALSNNTLWRTYFYQ